MKVLELFSGIGGIALGLEQLGWETVAFSEYDPGKNGKPPKRQYAAEVMAARFPNAVSCGDVTTLRFARNRAGVQGVLRPVETACECGGDRNIRCHERECGEACCTQFDTLYKGDIDIIAGGFPCQDISTAGRGAGMGEGTRSGLWSHFAEAIVGLKPRGVLIENVAALCSRGLDRVLVDLCAAGYDCEWDVIPAAGVGAPHLRERVFIIAWPQGRGVHGAWPDPPVSDFWKTEPDVSRLITGPTPDRSARLKCLGNAVVPQVAAWAGSRLQDRIGFRRYEHCDPAQWDARHKSGPLKGQSKIIGTAYSEMLTTVEGHSGEVEPSIAGSKLPRAGRMTGGIVFERERSCPQGIAKQVGLANMAPTLRPVHDSSPPLLPSPAAGNFNDGEDPDKWLERRERLKESSDAGNGAGMPLGIAAKLLPTPKATDGDKGVRTHAGAVREMARGRGGDLDAATKLLPTPVVTDAVGGSGHADSAQGGMNLRTAAKLLPTPYDQVGDTRLLPTPRASPNENRQTKPTPSQTDGKHGLNLSAFVHERKLLPTPVAQDSRSVRSQSAIRSENASPTAIAKAGETLLDYPDPTNGGRLLPTPTCRDHKDVGENVNYEAVADKGKLAGVVNAGWLLPTPQASDDRDRGNLSNPSIQRRARLGKQLMLSMVAGGPNPPARSGGALSPVWVEWVMGFEQSWTELP